MENNSYQLQDRGSQLGYNRYIAAMDAVSTEKVASASVFFDPSPGKTIVDIGMASGTSSNILALLYPKVNIIGVDINPAMIDYAQQTYQQPNLEFRLDDGEKLKTFETESIDGFFNCSSIHHITSFNSYQKGKAYHTLKRQVSLLREGGIIVVRDFVKPPEMEVILELSTIAGNTKPSDAELLLQFSRTARSLAPLNEQGFPVKEIATQKKDIRLFKLNYADAVEFIRRKDYYENWDIELQEEYGYFTQKEFEEVFANLGLRISISNPVFNPWILRNRYRDKFVIYDSKMNDIGFPPTNYVISGEKIKNRGYQLSLVRHLPESEKSFLKFTSYHDSELQKTYDVVQRPNSVTDIIPYYLNGENILVLAKHGYPRPLANLTTSSPIIDLKHYSGYITEGLTTGIHQNPETILRERANITTDQIIITENSLEYYTSPGGIDEKVKSIFVQLNRISEKDSIPQKSYSGFSELGTIRTFDAAQLLKSAQTGALAEARLELNLYNLFRKLQLNLPVWLGDPIVIENQELKNPTTLISLLKHKKSNFIQTSNPVGFMQNNRAKFEEEGIVNSSNILEYVTPQEFSINTLVTLPVARYKNEVYIGLEMRYLPVPQIHTENSLLFTAPAFRLPKTISNYKELGNYITNLKFVGSDVISFTKLGEKFFPSIGVTPEQVYPYIITLSKDTSDLHWVKLTELYENPHLVYDSHLLVSVFRLYHALYA